MNRPEPTKEDAGEARVSSPRYVSKQEAKRYLPLSDVSLWRLRRMGKIKAKSTGGRILFDLKSIEKYLESLSDPSSPE